jgi:hypothetical protein
MLSLPKYECADDNHDFKLPKEYEKKSKLMKMATNADSTSA